MLVLRGYRDDSGWRIPMKFYRVSLFLVLVVLVCLPGVTQAQIRFDIPFNFSAAGKTLSAGHYKVAEASSASQSAWVISNGRGSSVMTLTNSLESPLKTHKPSLVFRVTGDSYSLVQIWPSEHEGRDLLPRSTVTTKILSDGSKGVEPAKYVEIAAE
jgi:hypothetical protein